MNNQSIDQLLVDSVNELTSIELLIGQVGVMSPMCKYLTHYTVMKTCGVIEFSYKTIIADFHNGCSIQLQTYIDKTVRENSKNPSLDNIHSLLKNFDENWNNQFTSQMNSHPDKNRLITSLKSLNGNRNALAHGQQCNASFYDIKSYFNDAMEIIKIVDAVVV